MTTANLSVGIRTDSAKKSLQELKTWMAQEMRGVVLSINETAFSNSIKEALRGRKFDISINREQLMTSVESAVETAMQRQAFRINLDGAWLTQEVRTAVSAGMAGAKLGAVPAGAAGVGSVADIKTVITQILTPAVDELAKAAATMAANARAGGANSVATGRLRASQRYSRVEEDGSRVSVTKALDAAPEVLESIKQRNAARALEEEALRREQDLLKSRQSLVNQRIKEVGASEAAQLKLEQQAIATRQSLVNQRISEIGKDEQAQLRAEAAALRTRQSLVNQRIAQIGKEEAAREAAEVAVGKTRASLVDQRVKEIGRQELEAAKAEQRALATRQALVDQRIKQIAADEAASARAKQREMARAYEDAKFKAGDTYNARGTRVAGAQALVQQFGPDAARGFLGKSAGLVDEIANMESYRKAVKKAGDATKEKALQTNMLRASLNDAHSAARGLAGSLGLLWVTWGSTVPIVAAAALGGTLRSVFETGKDLEYQLKFVQVLTSGASISIKEFGDTIRGSMVGPVEAAQALRALAQNGLDAKESMMALPTVLSLATAGEMSLAEAALGATGVMAAFNLKVTELDRVGDVFAKAAAESNTSVAAMVESMKQASTVSDQYKVSLEETSAALATLAKRNITGSAAGTAFRNMMVELAAPSEKARKAMQQLGLQLYDSNNQLLSFEKVMSQLRTVTANLNEKSRITFLNEIFDERGAKAANSLLSDFETYKDTLGQLKKEANGFSREVVAALGETTQGKLKALMAEFQTATASVFNQNSDSIKNFVDQLRTYVASAEFKEFVTGLTRLVLDLTKFVAENTQAIIATVAAWKLFGLAVAGVPALLKFIEVGFVGLRAAALGTVGAMTGGLGLIAALAIEFLVLRKNTNDAEEAEKARLNTMRQANEAGEARIGTLVKENNLLAEQTRLLVLGTDAAKSKMDAEKNLASETIKRNIADGSSREQNALAEIARMKSDFAAAEREFGSTGARERLEALSAEAAAGRRLKEEGLRSEKIMEETYLQESLKRQQVRYQKAIEQLVQYNSQVDIVNKSGKYKLPLADIGAYRRAPVERIEEYAKDLVENKNRTLGKFERPDPKAESAARQQEKAEIRQAIEEIRAREAAEKQYIKFRRELNDAIYSTDKFGPYLAAKVAEQEAEKEQLRLFDLEGRALVDLLELRGRSGLTEADRTNIDTEINRRRESLKLLRNEIDQRKELALIKARNEAEKDERNFNAGLRKLSGADQEALDKQRQKFDTKITRGDDAAEAEARLAVEARYRSEIQKQQEAVLNAEDARFRIAEQINSASGDELAQALELEVSATSRLALEEARLAIMKAQANSAAEISGQVARKQFEDSQTAEYGWKRFWKEYVEQATSNARIVEDIMKNSTQTLEQAFGAFVTGTKVNFRSLMRDIAAQAAQMMASKAIRMLLEIAFNFAGSLGASSSTVGTMAGNSPGGVNPSTVGMSYANGGIMTAYGNLPLRTYDAGGIARRPQVAIYGEGKRPEAYVPLPDGRTIPVTMSMPAGAGGGDVNVSVSVSIQGDGRSKVESDSSGQRGQALGRMFGDSVRSIIMQEKREGGLLYNG